MGRNLFSCLHLELFVSFLFILGGQSLPQNYQSSFGGYSRPGGISMQSQGTPPMSSYGYNFGSEGPGGIPIMQSQGQGAAPMSSYGYNYGSENPSPGYYMPSTGYDPYGQSSQQPSLYETSPDYNPYYDPGQSMYQPPYFF